ARVALLVIGVVVDVLGYVLVQYRKGSGVGLVPGSARAFVVLDPAQLVVLLPQVRLEQFGRGQELQNGHVPLREASAGGRWRSGQQAARADGAGSDRGTLQQERTAVRQAPRLFGFFHYVLLQKLG